MRSYARSIRGAFWGLASLSPHVGKDKYQREIERCVKESKFVALNLHTIGHAANPLSEDGDLAFAIAHHFGITAMVHKGAGIPFSLPALCIPAANKYPKLKIVLAHARGAVWPAVGDTDRIVDKSPVGREALNPTLDTIIAKDRT
jgi:uncharacterized protein